MKSSVAVNWKSRGIVPSGSSSGEFRPEPLVQSRGPEPPEITDLDTGDFSAACHSLQSFFVDAQ